MFGTIWHALFFDPVYNFLIVILDHVPGGDLGIAIIVLTTAVKLILLPLSLRAAKTQLAMRTLEPELAGLKEKHNGDRERIARETMEAYKRAGVNPFASIVLTLIQLPIIFALYFAVTRGGGVPFPGINTALLYSFVAVPETVSMLFLGFVDIAEKGLVLALLAGITQFFQTKLSLPPLAPKEKTAGQDGTSDAKASFKDDFARSMQIQMRYIMPAIIFFVAYKFSATIALYFLVSNVIAIGQEYFVKWHIAERTPEKKA